mgnify:CR=1 FL=1
MSEFNLTYPTAGNQQESKIIKSGELLFLVGANGAGKSTLMYKFSTLNPHKARHITAHRQVWLQSNAMDLTPASREQNEQQMLARDQQPTARYRDDYAAQRSQVTIFDLIDAENVEARCIANAARAGNMAEVEVLARAQAPISKMNDILQVSNLNIKIQVDQGSKLLAVKGNNPPYSIAELSDGERNALLIIANILTAPSNSLILLDEPERHLHRSIVSPLISTLLAYRDDCAFVVSTHDVSLPLDQNKAAALLVRTYNHLPQFWEIDYIESVSNIDDGVAEAVLGARRSILFVEGSSSSLDLQIYQIIYPEVSIKPVGSCVEVERVVKGLNSSEDNHWVSAIGIIDRDNREDHECELLASNGIFAIDQYSVESIYYHPVVIQGVLNRVAQLSEISIEQTLEQMTDSLIRSVTPHKDRMAARIVERKVRDELLHRAPSWRTILQEEIEIHFSTVSLLDDEKNHISDLLENKNIEKIISRYPIRDTPALESVSNALGFQSQEKYEQAVRKMLIDDEHEKVKVRELLRPITDRIG